jgi:hypothetical protein
MKGTEEDTIEKTASKKRKPVQNEDETPLRRSERVKAAMIRFVEVFTMEPILLEEAVDV